MAVVMSAVRIEDVPGVELILDQELVKDLTPQGADGPFAMGVHPRGSRRAPPSLDAVRREDRVEAFGVLRVPVSEQETQRMRSHTQLEGKVSRLLHRPGSSGGMGSPGDVQQTCVVLEKQRCVQPAQIDQVDDLLATTLTTLVGYTLAKPQAPHASSRSSIQDQAPR